MIARAVVILAAGASSRLGQPKALLPFAGQTLLARAATAAAGTGALVWFTASNGETLTKHVQSVPHGTRCLLIPNADEGMSASLRAAATAAISDPHIQFLGVLPVDHYAVDTRWLTSLFDLAALYPDRMVASTVAGRRSAPAVFPRARFADLLMLTGDIGARQLLRDAVGDAIFEWPAPWPPGDVDTIEDLVTLTNWQRPS